jgi:hypothetical protein
VFIQGNFDFEFSELVWLEAGLCRALTITIPSAIVWNKGIRRFIVLFLILLLPIFLPGRSFSLLPVARIKDVAVSTMYLFSYRENGQQQTGCPSFRFHYLPRFRQIRVAIIEEAAAAQPTS